MRLRSIQSKILLSHITIIIISGLITALVFNLSMSAYLKNQTKSQLMTAARLVEKTLDKDFPLLDVEQKNKMITRIDKTLKQAQLFINIDYAFVTKDLSIVYPLQDNHGEFNFLQKNIIPLITKNEFSQSSQPGIKYVKLNGKPFAVTLYALKTQPTSLVIYSNLSNQTKAVIVTNLFLFAILVFTALLAVGISKRISKNISEPISQLGLYAQKIGERQYDVPSPQFHDKELAHLALTMQTMTKKLFTYDNTIKSFVQNASHELRTPLMSIQGYAEGIKYGVIPNQSDAIDIVIEESKRLSALVEDLLYLTRIDTFKDDLTLEETNLEHLLRSCIDRINGLIVKTNLKVNLSCPEDLILTADEEKLSRALINILANATRHAKSKIDITVRVEKEQLFVEISDDGEGINEKDLPHIFERFFKGVGGNYGLGLTIAKTIIENHQGTISVANNPEGGALFSILFPLERFHVPCLLSSPMLDNCECGCGSNQCVATKVQR